jgi:hypothetical protein
MMATPEVYDKLPCLRCTILVDNSGLKAPSSPQILGCHFEHTAMKLFSFRAQTHVEDLQERMTNSSAAVALDRLTSVN